MGGNCPTCHRYFLTDENLRKHSLKHPGSQGPAPNLSGNLVAEPNENHLTKELGYLRLKLDLTVLLGGRAELVEELTLDVQLAGFMDDRQINPSAIPGKPIEERVFKFLELYHGSLLFRSRYICYTMDRLERLFSPFSVEDL